MSTGDKLETLIGGGCRVQGMVHTQGSLRVDGQVEGEITASGDVFVGDGGKVTAGIKARNVTVAGEVGGSVEASATLELLPSARIQGDVRVGKLVVAPGALFKGACRMDSSAEQREEKPVSHLTELFPGK